MRILVAAEYPSLADTVALAFADTPNLSVVTVSDAAQAADTIHTAQADNTPFQFGVLDYRLAGLSGLKSVRHLITRMPGAAVALLLDGVSLQLAQRAHLIGANGVLSRELPQEELILGLKLAERGTFLTVFSELSSDRDADALAQLSDRELQVLRGLCDGMQNKEIAHAFAIQEVTVKMHMRAVVRKLGAKNRTHAAMIARDMRLV